MPKKIYKIGSSGFMLAEVIISSTLISIILVTLFILLNRLNLKYELREKYYDIDTAYLTGEVNNLLINDGSINTFISNKESTLVSGEITSIKTLEESYESSLKVKARTYFSLYNENDITALKDKNNNKTFGDYIDYLGRNLDFSLEFKYVIVGEMCQREDSDICHYYTLKVR